MEQTQSMIVFRWAFLLNSTTSALLIKCLNKKNVLKCEIFRTWRPAPFQNLYPSLVTLTKIYNADWKILAISGLAHKSDYVCKISKIKKNQIKVIW